jgi:hypothetical protein
MSAGHPYLGAAIETTLNGAAAYDALYTAVLLALKDKFEGEILADAKGNCPVGTDPIEPGSERNRDSIGVAVFGTRKGPMAKLFSQSGHGGFVEVGTVDMGAQPYAWPAVQKNIGAIMLEIRARIQGVSIPGEGVELGRVIQEP